MRKHSVRKFIHAVLDCLPLMVIPIFAIYSQNHEINDNTLQVQENKMADFNQIVENGNFNNGNQNFTLPNNVTYTIEDNIYKASVIDTSISGNRYIMFANGSSVESNTTYFLHIYLQTNSNRITWQCIQSNPYAVIFSHNINDLPADTTTEITVNHLVENSNADVRFTLVFDGGTYLNISYVNIVNGTQLFGYANQPNNTQYKEYFPLEYYNYGNYNVIVDNYITETYDDTDIMSQFMYVTYNAVDKYFNMNRVFNLGNIWNWVQNTLFGGQAPLSAFIVYNVIAYEFIMDIIFLIYLVLMWLIDWVECCLDRFLKKAS